MKLKKIFVNMIIIFQLINIMLLGSECDDLKLFIISKIIIMLLMLINHYILTKYSDIYKEV